MVCHQFLLAKTDGLPIGEGLYGSSGITLSLPSAYQTSDGCNSPARFSSPQSYVEATVWNLTKGGRAKSTWTRKRDASSTALLNFRWLQGIGPVCDGVDLFDGGDAKTQHANMSAPFWQVSCEATFLQERIWLAVPGPTWRPGVQPVAALSRIRYISGERQAFPKRLFDQGHTRSAAIA